MKNTRFSRNRIIYILLLSLMHPIGSMSADQYFMAAHGKDMLANGLTRATDIFTVHNLDFMYQKWAMCIVSHWIYKFFGDVGFVVGAYVLFFIFLLTMSYALERLNPGRKEFNVPMLFAVAFMMMNFASFRPQMIEITLLILLLLLLESFIQNPQKIHYVYFLLISMAAMWIHSTMWVMMPVFMLPYLCDFGFLQKLPGCIESKSNKINLLKAFGVVLFGSLLQPYGVKEYKYLYVCLTATSDIYQEIIPELNPNLLSNSTLSVFLLVVLGIAFSYKYKKYRLRAVYMLMGGLLMPIVAYRMCLYSIVIIPFGLALNYQLYEVKITEKAIKALSGLCVLATIGIVALVFTTAPLGYETSMEYFGKTAIDQLPQSKVFCSTMDAGSYAIAKGNKTYVDCRAEVYDIKLNHKKDLLTEYGNLIIGKYKDNNTDTYMKDFNDDYGFDYYVIHNEGIMLNKSLSKCAKLVYEDKYNKVYSFE